MEGQGRRVFFTNYSQVIFFSCLGLCASVDSMMMA
jgi:hypothetical protein